jgi:hypothetical protein
MRPPHLVTTVAVAVLCGSCTERTAPTDGIPGSLTASFSFINGPGSPGNSGLFRFEQFYFEVGIDERSRLVSIHGLQSTVADMCGGLGESHLADHQFKPHNAGELNSLIVDRTSPVQILELPAEPGDFCEDLSGAPVLYRGTAAFRRLDNNLTSTGLEGRRANTWGWTVEGVLDDLVHGGQVRYDEEARFVISPQDEFKVLVSNINIH